MTVKIETYRGFDISFDTEKEKFACNIDDIGHFDKQSYTAAKKWVDNYLKENSQFAPFDIISMEDMFNSKKRLKVVGIRKDGRFVTEDNEGNKSQLSDWDEKRYLLDTPYLQKPLSSLVVLNLEKDNIHKQIESKRKEIESIGTTLLSIKSNYLQSV